MQFETATKCFKNAAQRNYFVNEVLAAFEAALGHAELILLYQQFEPRLNGLRDSAQEYDQLAHEVVMTRYHGLHERLDEQATKERAFLRCSCNQD